MTDNHCPEEGGLVDSKGDPFTYPKAAELAVAVADHGEAHATFEEVDEEVEVRLGTATFDYEAGLIRVHDGDDYVPFSMDHLVTWYKPLEIHH